MAEKSNHDDFRDRAQQEYRRRQAEGRLSESSPLDLPPSFFIISGLLLAPSFRCGLSYTTLPAHNAYDKYLDCLGAVRYFWLWCGVHDYNFVLILFMQPYRSCTANMRGVGWKEWSFSKSVLLSPPHPVHQNCGGLNSPSAMRLPTLEVHY